VPRTNEGRAIVFLFILKSFSDRIHVSTHVFLCFLRLNSSYGFILQNGRHWRRRSWWCSVRRIRQRRIGRQYMLTYMIDVRLDGFLRKRVIDWEEGTVDMRLHHKSSRQFQGQFQHWLKIFLTLVIFTMLNPALGCLCQVHPGSLLRSCCACVVASDKLLYDIFNETRTCNRRNCMDVYDSPSDRWAILTTEPRNASSSFS